MYIACLRARKHPTFGDMTLTIYYENACIFGSLSGCNQIFQMYGHDAEKPRPSLYTKYYHTL